MQPEQQSSTPPSNLNWSAIHAVYAQHRKKMGTMQRNPAPQPEHNSPGYAMMIHAMSQVPTKPGEDHGTMIIRAMDQHLKRITPDVNSIHKEKKPEGGSGYC